VRALVVEDERRLAEGIGAGLEAEGYAVDLAHDGLDGLWRAREQDYDAIVLDLMLPGMNGYRVCSALRDEGVWTPILVLTAKEGEWDEVEALDTGADDFLSQAVLPRGAGRSPAGDDAAPTAHSPGDPRGR
jgi:DNA-binding response OmpR family regulator